MNKSDKISLVINTKNEEKNITDCILSAKSVVDEIIVVDMQSTDKTTELAKKLGAKVYKVNDYQHVEPARNFALSKVTMPWTLVLDADERLTEVVRSKIKKLVQSDEYDGYKLPIKNILLGKWIKHSMWWPDFRLRLFKTGRTDWPVQIHKEQKFEGTVFNLSPKEENAVVHYNIADIKELLEMVDRYSSVETSFQSKKNPTADDFVSYIECEFKWRYFEHKGYLDGMHGFILAKFMNFYRLLEVSKMWERKGYKNLFDPMRLKKAAESNFILENEVVKLKEDLKKIQSAKFYKIWQLYCQIRDLIRQRFSIK